jgi:hypothetical protein
MMNQIAIQSLAANPALASRRLTDYCAGITRYRTFGDIVGKKTRQGIVAHMAKRAK